jgi:SAM-dependent methyltransferase
LGNDYHKGDKCGTCRRIPCPTTSFTSGKRTISVPDPRRPILDIGAGQGRNTLYLARTGFSVVAVDTSRIAIETILKTAVEEALPVEAHVCDFHDFSLSTDYYSGILVYGLIQVLDWASIKALISKLDRWTRKGSLVFITAFTTEDPRYPAIEQTSRKIGKNSYVVETEEDEEDGEDEEVRTYLEKDELLGFFEDWEVLYHWQGLGPEHMHGCGPSEKHGKVEAVFRKQGGSTGR